MQRKGIGYTAQCRSLTLVRQDDPNGIGSIAVAVARGALRRVDEAFAAFFRRVRNGEKPGYPRFRSRKRYCTSEVRDVNDANVRHVGRRTHVRLSGLPLIRIERRRELPEGKPRSIRIVRRACGVTVCLVYAREPVALPDDGRVVGVDVGVRKRLTLSTDETIPAEGIDWKALRRAQRALSRSQRGSNPASQARGGAGRLAPEGPRAPAQRVPPDHHRSGGPLRHHRRREPPDREPDGLGGRYR